MECVYNAKEGETVLQAHKRKYSDLESEHEKYKDLIKILCTRPDSEAYEILGSMRRTQEPLAVFEALKRTELASESSPFLERALDGPSLEPGRQGPDGPMILVPARPWTAESDSDVVSALITDYFTHDNCYIMPLGRRNVFVEEMKSGNVSSAKWCSPLLVNAICAHRAVRAPSPTTQPATRC